MNDLRFNKFNKIIYKVRLLFVRFLKIISQDKYVYAYRRLLADYGMNIDPTDWGYIDPSAFFDNYDYSLITIGQNVTVSREVLFLNHDFSICQGLLAADINEKGYFLKKIEIGDNCFIGAKVTILPGTTVGENCIIGAGAVVKGNIPANSVLVGNPAKIIAKTDEFGKKHFEKKDYILVE